MEMTRPVSHKLTDKVTTHLPEYLADMLRQLAWYANWRSILKVEGATQAQQRAETGAQV